MTYEQNKGPNDPSIEELDLYGNLAAKRLEGVDLDEIKNRPIFPPEMTKDDEPQLLAEFTRIHPSDCKHHRSDLLTKSDWTGDDGRHGHYAVFLCMDCGEFQIVGDENGQHYKINFALASERHVKAAGKWAALLRGE